MNGEKIFSTIINIPTQTYLLDKHTFIHREEMSRNQQMISQQLHISKIDLSYKYIQISQTYLSNFN